MCTRLLLALVFVAAWLPASRLGAVGTPAGQSIANQATVSWETPSGPDSGTSNAVMLQVDELIDVSTTLQTAANVIVAPGAVGERLTFRVENVGNGIESFTLTVFNAAVTNDFNPLLASIFVDTDPDGAGPLLPDAIFDPAVDLAYAPGSPPTLDANTPGRESITVFVLNDIPGPSPPPTDGDLGESRLTAESVTAAGLSGGHAIPGGGDAGVDAVVAPEGPTSAAFGTYEIANAIVDVAKTGTLLGPQAISGIQIEYRLDVSVSGLATATAIVITDPIPAGTTYVPGSIELDSTPLSDVPGDGADFDVTNPGAVTVNLGDMSAATPPRTVTFQVTID